VMRVLVKDENGVRLTRSFGRSEVVAIPPESRAGCR
jgi:hypothetical protein